MIALQANLGPFKHQHWERISFDLNHLGWGLTFRKHTSLIILHHHATWRSVGRQFTCDNTVKTQCSIVTRLVTATMPVTGGPPLAGGITGCKHGAMFDKIGQEKLHDRCSPLKLFCWTKSWLKDCYITSVPHSSVFWNHLWMVDHHLDISKLSSNKYTYWF